MKHLADLAVHVIAGSSLVDLQRKALPPYSPEAIAFLTEWSKRILVHPDLRGYPDAASFAFWCRPANLLRLNREFGSEPSRIGRGVALHIAPSNVPVNFAFSLAFGLLAGNINIVRVSERLPTQAFVLCAVAKELLMRQEHFRIASMTTLLSYPRDDVITQRLSAVADVRLLWGGDQAVNHLRRLPAPPRCVDIPFADRYSLCLLSAPAVLAAESKALLALTVGFYNDAFRLDQNACSSPHLVLWKGTPQEVESAQERFWGAMHEMLSLKDAVADAHAVEKYIHLCRTAILMRGARATPTASNRVVRVFLDDPPENIDEYRGRYGFFFEAVDNNLTQLGRIVNARYQTLTYFGLDPNDLTQYVVDNGLTGIDRVVPVGRALDIGVIWDGYDLIRTMSRIIATQ